MSSVNVTNPKKKITEVCERRRYMLKSRFDNSRPHFCIPHILSS